MDTSFWVWQRNTPLNKGEIEGLKNAGTKSLYWQVGTLELRSSQWSWKERFSVPFPQLRTSAPFLHFVPVIRLELVKGEEFGPKDFSSLHSILEDIISSTGADMLQIDYESPDRVIPLYQDFLRFLKQDGRAWKLSISALGHWSKFANGFDGLTDEITPMFYDLNPSVEMMKGDFLPPLIDAQAEEKQISAWKESKVPWKAGLPNFSRLSIVNLQGLNRGNVRHWVLDEIWFSPLLTPTHPTSEGETVFQVMKKSIVANALVGANEKLVIRYPELPSLIHLESVAKNSGASGILFFRLGDDSDMSGYSVAALQERTLPRSSPTLERSQSGCITLNNSGHDLMPRVSPSGVRGYSLELKADTGSWREAIPGDFYKATTDPEGKHPLNDPVGLEVGTIYFWFSRLRSDQSLQTGLLQYHSSQPIYWHLPDLEDETSWHPLD